MKILTNFASLMGTLTNLFLFISDTANSVTLRNVLPARVASCRLAFTSFKSVLDKLTTIVVLIG